MVRIDELKWESTGAKGSPQDRRSGLRVCPKCFDPIHPLSKLPDAIRMKLPDAEALYQPRVDIFPIAYPVFLTLPGAIFRPNPLSVAHGTTGLNLLANGMYVANGQPFTAIGDSNVTFTSVQYVNEQLVRVTINVNSLATIGIDGNLFIVDGAGNNLRTKLNIV